MVAEDLMCRAPIVGAEQLNLLDAWRRMQMARIRHMPIVRGRRLVGVLTDRDVLECMPSRFAEMDADARDSLMSDMRACDVMSRDVATVRHDADVAFVAQQMLARKLAYMPVLDPSDELLGMLTESDFLRLTRTILDEVEA